MQQPTEICAFLPEPKHLLWEFLIKKKYLFEKYKFHIQNGSF